MFQESVTRYGPKDALLYKDEGVYRSISYNEFSERVKHFSLGLTTLGIEPGDRVALISENRPQWVIADLAILAAGAINVPMFPTLPPQQLEYIINDSGACAAIVSTAAQLMKITEIKDNTPELQHIIIMDELPPEASIDNLCHFDTVTQSGTTVDESIYQQRVESIEPNDTATIIYTSGTTGQPKGVMLSHYNFVSNAIAGGGVFDIDENDVLLSCLPLSHVFERTGGYYVPLAYGATVAYAESPYTVAQNLVEVHPTIMVAVPRLYEMMYARILRTVESSSALKQKLFNWGIGVGKEISRRIQQNQHVSKILSLKAQLADLLVFRKLRQRTGGRIRFFVSGGAALSQPIAEFFHAAGILILEGYGLTESSPIISVNRPDKYKFGTVGPMIPEVEVTIADDGEILTRGPHVMQGYFNNPEETEAAINGEGWLHTGDIGILDEDGFLKITDRKKSIIVLSGGKNVAPQPIENQLLQSRYIQQVMLIGDGRKSIAALIVPEFESLRQYASDNNIQHQSMTELLATNAIKQLFRGEIDLLSANLADFERVKMFTLLENEFTQEGGEITPTLKLKRKVVLEKHSEAIEQMYGAIG